ncbi:beta-ketoacyl synthase chain length factor [Uliginosibacterium sp. H3]|uniref:Beta-ketoacyl synthase chain length factor n=1 Tax=Uliginosibacterium silvisoli TaxID=3114758 RepID=A0ABU6JYD1_9RHOO|nr:beta-ketoacyl synthase chain length factor [Uliginosibacterium sp. H3]
MTTAHTTVHLLGLGAIGPGFADWPTLAALLRDEQTWSHTPTQIPALQVLPPAERRRIGVVIKLALATGLEAAQHAERDPAKLASVFSASNAEGENCHALCEALAGSDRFISPTRFHNSVHNASSGYWSIATGCMAQSTSLCAYDASFAAGLLEAATQVASTGDDCLLVVHDSVYPHPLGTARPLLDNMAIGLVLSAQAGNRSLARLDLSLSADATLSAVPPELAALQTGTPSGRALPLLSAVARKQETRVTLEYLAPLGLSVSITPCR